MLTLSTSGFQCAQTFGDYFYIHTHVVNAVHCGVWCLITTHSVCTQPLDDTKTGAAVKAKAGEDGKLLKDANKQRGRKALWERIISDRAAAESTYR